MMSTGLAASGRVGSGPEDALPAKDLIVIGASAGGVGALVRLAGDLPRDCPAAVAIAIHLPPRSSSNLPSILARNAKLPAAFAAHGEKIEPSRIYVAPPDHHLTLSDGTFQLSRGPRENRHRPSIDVLFRSAARSFGPRLIGVVLSGYLDDGTIGLDAIRRAGGTAVVQDPAEAEFPSMPTSALENAGADHCVPLFEMGPLLARLVGRGGKEPIMDPSDGGEERATPAAPDSPEPTTAEPAQHAAPSIFGCPDCGGVLWELRAGELSRYQCRVGHAYSSEELLERQEESFEDALWAAARALEEQRDLARRLAERSRSRGYELTAGRFEARALAAHDRAELVRSVLRRSFERLGSVQRASPVEPPQESSDPPPK